MGQRDSEKKRKVVQETNGGGPKTGKAKKRARPPVAVKIIGREGESVLVEYEAQRYHLPATVLNGNDVDPTEIERAIPYGEDWTQWDTGSGAKAFAAQLYAIGIYTKGDLLKESHEVRAVLQRVYVNPKLAAMLERAGAK